MRKKENGDKPWCVFFSHWVPLGWAQSRGWRLSSALLIVPSLPEDPFPKPLQASRDNDESRRLKQMVTEPFLSSTHPWCYSAVGKKWKAESYLGGRAGLLLAELQLTSFKIIVKCCFFSVLPTQNHIIFMTDFYVIGLKSSGENFLCSFPFLLRPCNTGINSLLLVLIMSCWHFITVDVVIAIFNSSSESGIAGPLNILVFSVVKAGSRCWVNNSLVCVQKNALWCLFQIFSHVFFKGFYWASQITQQGFYSILTFENIILVNEKVSTGTARTLG